MAKKGYTKIENTIFDALLSPELRDAELKILLFFLRYTLGFKRKTVRASYGYIASGTGYSVDTVRNITKILIKKGIIERAYEASGSKAQVWVLSYERIHTSYVSTFIHDMGVESHILMGVESHQDIKEDIKDKYIKDKETASPSFSLEEVAKMSWDLEDDEDE